MDQDCERYDGCIQICYIVNIQRNTVFRRCPSYIKPFFRLGVVLGGFVLWVLLQEFLSRIFSFIENGILNYAATGFISLGVLFPFWKLVPEVAGKTGRRDLRSAAAASAVLFIPFIVIALVTGFSYTGFNPEWLLFAAALFFLAASEEIICRGFMMDAFSFRGNRIAGLMLSSFAFAMLHLGNSHASYAGIANIFLAGILFGLIRMITDGLLYPTLLHWLWNLATGMVFGWSVSGHALLPTLFKPLYHPPWGSFGPEESILMTIATLGAIAVLVKKMYLPDYDTLPRIN